jgi:hypothetical protein
MLRVAPHPHDHRRRKIEVRGCNLFEFRTDKIARKDSYWKIVDA